MTEDYKTSAFNQAQLQIQRLDDTWKKATLSRIKNRLDKYRQHLETAEIELLYDAGKIDREQKTKYLEQLKKINTELTNSYLKLDLLSFKKNLMYKEVVLREIQEESGKGSVWKDEFEDEMD